MNKYILISEFPRPLFSALRSSYGSHTIWSLLSFAEEERNESIWTMHHSFKSSAIAFCKMPGSEEIKNGQKLVH